MRKYSKKRKTAIIVTAILIMAVLSVIWSFSAMPTTVSSGQSGSVFEVFRPLFDAVLGEGIITEAVFRKMAHFGEYFVLGTLVFILFYLATDNYVFLAEPACFGLIVAVIDESIQILSQRGPAVQDILLDYSGYACGALIVGITGFIIRKKKK